MAADLVRPGGDARAFRFRHPLVLRAVYDGAPPAWRLGAHERVAAVLAARGAAPGVRAYHVEQYARPGDEGAIALLGEAAAAAAATAPATAARWYGAAVRLLPDGDAERRGGLLAAQAVALADAGRLEEGREALIEVLGLLPPGPSPFKPSADRRPRPARAAARPPRRRQPAPRRRARRGAAAGARDARDPAGDRLRVRLATPAACASRPRGRSPTRPATPALVVTATALSGLGAQWEADRAASDAALAAAEAGYAQLSDEALAGRLDTALWLGWGQMLTERFAGRRADAAALRRRRRAARPGAPAGHPHRAALAQPDELARARRGAADERDRRGARPARAASTRRCSGRCGRACSSSAWRASRPRPSGPRPRRSTWSRAWSPTAA